MSINIQDLGDFEGKYDLEESQALRILSEVSDIQDFEYDWSECDYWLTEADYIAYLMKVEG